MSRRPVHRALVSVYDKTGLTALAARLVAAGVELVSSGGTARALEEAGLAVTRVADITGAPEILGGRVKTLHPDIHGGLLADRTDPGHLADLAGRGIEPFDLVVANLYPFEATAARPGVTDGEVIEQIDIGGPAMIRAAAKNHAWVGVVTSPDRYDEVVAAVEAGGLDDDLRADLAREAFFVTSAYDAAILGWLERREELPERMVVALRRRAPLRYGENPHQPAALYSRVGDSAWWQHASQLQGKEPSFNNLADAEAAWRLVGDLDGPAAVIVKHLNPCGVAVGADLPGAYRAAWDCDPLSAFGGVVALNRPLDAITAAGISAVFVEVVVAPGAEPAALEELAARPNLRVLIAPPAGNEGLDMRRVEGGFLVQRRDDVDRSASWEVKSRRPPTGEEWDDLRFAWVVAAHTRSNAVVIARRQAAVGVGAGDQSRVGAAERAVRRAGERSKGAVAASDAFFPFRDGLDTLAAAGVSAIVEPGGSRRDGEVVAAADEHGLALVFSGRRHFRH